MAWSRPFTSSASSILKVKDRQALKDVQSYHKSKSLLGERSRGDRGAARRNPLFSRVEKGRNSRLVRSVSEQMHRSGQTDTCNEGVLGGRRWGCWHELTDKFERQRHKPFSFRSCQLFVIMCTVSKAHSLINCSLPKPFFSRRGKGNHVAGVWISLCCYRTLCVGVCEWIWVSSLALWLWSSEREPYLDWGRNAKSFVCLSPSYWLCITDIL